MTTAEPGTGAPPRESAPAGYGLARGALLPVGRARPGVRGRLVPAAAPRPRSVDLRRGRGVVGLHARPRSRQPLGGGQRVAPPLAPHGVRRASSSASPSTRSRSRSLVAGVEALYPALFAALEGQPLLLALALRARLRRPRPADVPDGGEPARRRRVGRRPFGRRSRRAWRGCTRSTLSAASRARSSPVSCWSRSSG